MKLIPFLIEAIYWLGIFASPFLPCLIASAFVYYYTNNIYYTAAVILFGAILGFLFAEWARKKYGASNFMSRLSSTPEPDKPVDEENEINSENKSFS